jgi:predicted ATPase/class 3 adenylate cyclase
VTFLFTDVEGSSRNWEEHPDAMRSALARHDELIETLVVRNAGTLVRPRGEGDSRFAVFARATDAVAAAAAAQEALHVEPWPAEMPLRVRLALHTGEADLRAGDYYGSAVNRCARLRSIAHGGQVLLSQTTFDLVRDALPAGVTVRDLGEHRLSDLARPERVFQLTAPGTPADFPPLGSSFVGRDQELVDVVARLENARLLTLTGVGGCGKTRLALEVGRQVLAGYDGGVWLVELGPLTDPALVAHRVGAVLGVRERPEVPIIRALATALGNRHLLVVLDNCEHLLDACAVLVQSLLSTCPRLQVLATSREPLSTGGEVVRRVPSLPVPDSSAAPAAVAANPSVQLFVERATAVQSRFVLNERNTAAVVQICRRLDGIPLALELAAARSDVLTAERLAERLDKRFQLLTGGSRTALPRQQTLAATLEWSYDLLGKGERMLFERLSVFSGGWTLEAAEQVCPGPALNVDDVLDVLARLTRKSLLVSDEAIDGTERYRLSETVREYARQKLARRGVAEVARLRSQHAEFYTRLAEQLDPWALADAPLIRSQGQVSAAQIARTAVENDNFRAALAWWLEAGRATDGLRLATARWEFWQSHGLYTEGRHWLAELLELAERGGGGRAAEIPPRLHVEALREAAFVETMCGDYP